MYKHHSEYSFEEMTERINTLFGYDKTVSNVKRYMQHLRLPPKSKKKVSKYTEEMDNFIRNNAKGISTIRLAELFNKEFGTDVTRSAIKSRMRRLGVHNELLLSKDTHPAINSSNAISTRFKKGEANCKAKPIGSERVNKKGYVEVKIARDKWEKKHRVIYEEAFGKFGDNEGVIFLDGNKQNLELSNLKKVSIRELLVANKYNLLFDNQELTTTGVNIAKLMIATKDASKRLEE